MDVLITHYEQGQTLEDSVESLYSQLDDDDTIYVVDAGSTDGSFHELETLHSRDRIELIYENGVSRGRGRQIAFDQSESDVVVVHADLDTIFHPVLKDLEEEYRRLRSDRGPGLLLVHGCFVSDRRTIESIGGWNDLQVHEDKDLWVRATQETSLYQMPISVVQRHHNFEWKSRRYRLKRLYQNYRDAIRLGIPKDALRTSDRHHQPTSTVPLNSALRSIAARRASGLETYRTFEDDYPDPRSFHLRELTFGSLVESGLIDPEVVQYPEYLVSYQSSDTFPGKTSYL